MSKEARTERKLAKKLKKEAEKAAKEEEKRRSYLYDFFPDYEEDEFEDKYLVDPPSQEILAKARPIKILVGYMPDGKRIRLDKTSDRIVISRTSDKKKSITEQHRRELRQNLSQEQFDARFELTRGARLRKTRWEVIYGQYKIHYDQFRGRNLYGHWLAEVEAPSVEALDAFFKNPPDSFKNSDGKVHRLMGNERREISTKLLAHNGWPNKTLAAAV